jgi:hypothetical protein
MRRWNLFQKLAFLAGLGVTLHLLVLLAIGPDPLGFDGDGGWFAYAPNDGELRSTSTYGSDDRFTRLADTLIRIAGVALWTAGAIWLLGERPSRDDD